MTRQNERWLALFPWETESRSCESTSEIVLSPRNPAGSTPARSILEEVVKRSPFNMTSATAAMIVDSNGSRIGVIRLEKKKGVARYAVRWLGERRASAICSTPSAALSQAIQSAPLILFSGPFDYRRGPAWSNE